MDANFSGYVLAGGRSSRMGRDKAFLEFSGDTFLARAVEVLQTVCRERVKIVLNRRQTDFIEKIPAGIPAVFDVYAERGALGGIHAALADCRTGCAVIIACDLPFVSVEAIKNLSEMALAAERFEAVIPRQPDGRLQPLCAVYRAEKCLAKLEKYISQSSSNAVRDFLETLDAKIVDANTLADDENLFFNVNRPADFESIRPK